MASLYKDPLFRRFISGSAFAGAFIWVAIAYFDVELEVVWVFFIFSIGFVVLMVLAGLLLSPVIRLFNRPRGMLARLDDRGNLAGTDEEDETEAQSDVKDQPPPVDRSS